MLKDAVIYTVSSLLFHGARTCPVQSITCTRVSFNLAARPDGSDGPPLPRDERVYVWVRRYVSPQEPKMSHVSPCPQRRRVRSAAGGLAECGVRNEDLKTVPRYHSHEALA